MAQNITLMGASYSAVPAVQLPKTGGGLAAFTDVSDTTAAAADVASGKYFYTAAGVRTQGTNSGGGGGGGGGPTLLVTKSLGTISTTSTSATDTGQKVDVTGINNYDLLIVIVSADTKANNKHYATISTIALNATSNISTKNGYTTNSCKQNIKLSSSGVASARGGTTQYGIYPNSATTPSGGATTLTLYMRYNSTNTGTINSDYTVRVYGMNLYGLIE